MSGEISSDTHFNPCRIVWPVMVPGGVFFLENGSNFGNLQAL